MFLCIQVGSSFSFLPVSLMDKVVSCFMESLHWVQRLGFVKGARLSVKVLLFPIDVSWTTIVKDDFDEIRLFWAILTPLLWTYYGITKPDYIVAIYNGFGFAVVAIFIIAILMNDKRVNSFAFLSGQVGLFLTLLLITDRVEVIGAVSAVVNVLAYVEPTAIMRKMVMTGSVEGVSFVLLFRRLVWASYAFLVRDIWIGIPNGVGFVLGAAQIAIYFRNLAVCAS